MRKEFLKGEPVETIYFGGSPLTACRRGFPRVFETIRKYYGEWNTAERFPSKNPDDLTGSLCRHAGFNNISIDLIYGLPGETDERWKRDLQQAVSLNVEHISRLPPDIRRRHSHYELLQAHRIREVDEESSVRFFSTLIDTLGSAGYEHYEISNFCRSDMYSRHNTSYWKGIPLLGCGPSGIFIQYGYPRMECGFLEKIYTCHRKQSTLVRTGAPGPDHLL